MRYKRLLSFKNLSSSIFLFGPRMVGKTALLKTLDATLYENLLDPEIELNLNREPKKFWDKISKLKRGSTVIVDEIQRVPKLLDYAQMGIEDLGLRFILCGSSARKLKRQGANLLGGRALDLKLHALGVEELGKDFDLEKVLRFGSLPRVSSLVADGAVGEAELALRAYLSIYIKEEIQAEALTRNVGAFQRFLHIAVQSNGLFIEYSNIGKTSKVADSTVKEYFSILEDTLLGTFIWPWDRSERKKARPKFYFFDPGVVRAVQGRLDAPPTSQEKGRLFEQYFLYELIRMRDYAFKTFTVDLWRERDYEVDFLLSDARGPFLAIECKYGDGSEVTTEALKRFRSLFPHVKVIVASAIATKPQKLEGGFDLLPWRMVLQEFLA